MWKIFSTKSNFSVSLSQSGGSGMGISVPDTQTHTRVFRISMYGHSLSRHQTSLYIVRYALKKKHLQKKNALQQLIISYQAKPRRYSQSLIKLFFWGFIVLFVKILTLISLIWLRKMNLSILLYHLFHYLKILKNQFSWPN